MTGEINDINRTIRTAAVCLTGLVMVFGILRNNNIIPQTFNTTL